MDIGNRSFENLVHLVRSTVNNMGKERIFSALSKFGISQQDIDEGKSLLDNIDETEKRALVKRGNYYKAMDRFDLAWADLRSISADHVRFCRLLFRNRTGVLEKINLKGNRPRAFLPWLETTKQFYTSLLEDKSLIDTLKKRNITRQELTGTLKDLENLEELNRLKNMGKEEMRATKMELKECLNSALAWRHEIIVFARAGLGKNAPILEALGVKVKIKR